MAITYVLRKFVVWADGYGKLGEGENCKLPTMEIHTEDYRGGGMDIPVKIDLGQTPLAFEFKLSSFDPQCYALWGLQCGDERQYTVRGALANCGPSGTPFAAVAAMSGYMHKTDADAFEPGRKVMHTFTCDLTYYRLTIGEQPIYEIDAINGIRIVGGYDQTINDRIALGLSLAV